MTIPVKGSMLVQVAPNAYEDYEIQYNPTELTFDKGAQFAEIGIPGLDAPIQQFVRGGAEKLTLELFCDTTDQGTGINATSVTRETDKFYQLVKVVPALHAPPVVTFYWHHEFSGNRVHEDWGNNRRNSFTGVAESVRQRFTMFSPEGVPLRATVTLTLREWRPLEEQLFELKLESPDRTHWHQLGSGETLSALAARYYERPGDWRAIAGSNGIEDPRRLAPGSTLTIPSLH
ncbi:LysM domain protein [Caballeronia arationis]|jgi:hypothetical protein|uniref:LysM domain-containing protein n=1 Tax=Caballeronia arationis TaxID=1777142 RepID=A0A7Z7N151_9BURK|nr:LysM peptidoglycan-binding domain-containing protein [Caballeronia arationis]SAK99969.1 LysM domain protein [Caballeronia arationis]SOE54462.1 LysM domain-containing protein [Caballeronia arationis]